MTTGRAAGELAAHRERLTRQTLEEELLQDLSQIAVHREYHEPNQLTVYAWCVTCNARENGSAQFAHGSTGLSQLIKAALEHLASEQHTAIPG